MPAPTLGRSDNAGAGQARTADGHAIVVLAKDTRGTNRAIRLVSLSEDSVPSPSVRNQPGAVDTLGKDARPSVGADAIVHSNDSAVKLSVANPTDSFKFLAIAQDPDFAVIVASSHKACHEFSPQEG